MKINLKNINIIFISAILLVCLSYLPYVNLVITSLFICISLFLIFIFTFNVSSRGCIIIGILLLIASLPWLLIGNRISPEILGILSFISFLVGFLKESLKLRGEN